MENQTVTHITQNGKFRVIFERSAVKGVDGFKVEANGDVLSLVELDAQILYENAQKVTKLKEV